MGKRKVREGKEAGEAYSAIKVTWSSGRLAARRAESNDSRYQDAADSRSGCPCTSFPFPQPRPACPSFLCAKVRSAAGSRTQVTSHRSARGQPSSPRGLAAPSRPSSPRGRAPGRSPQSEPHFGTRGQLGRVSRPSLLPQRGRAGSARPAGTRGGGVEEGWEGVARTPLAAVATAPRRAHDGLLPQRRGRQGGGGARPDAGGKAEARAQAAAAAAGDPGGRPRRGGLPGRRHSGDAAAGGARGRDPGTAGPPIPLSASAPSPGVGHPRPIGPREPGGAPG